MLPGRGVPTPLEIFETAFGAWLSDKILLELNANINRIAPNHAAAQQKRWHTFDYQELMAFFLYQLLGAIQAQPEKTHDFNACDALMAKLVSPDSCKVICAALNFHDDILKSVLDGIPFCLQRLVALGGVIVVDEAIWSYHSPGAKKNKIIRHLPSKPHKDGMLTYLLCQRLHFTGRPISLAFAPTWLGSAPSPHEALMALNAILHRSGFDRPADWILVTDSLWSYPKHIFEFLELHWRFVLSAKDNTAVVPGELRTFASESLRKGYARTFTDKFLTLQLFNGEQGVTSVISNVASHAGTLPPGDLPKLSYKTALAIFENDTPASIIRAFSLSEDCLLLSLAQIVHKATGWDVLRPPHRQGDTTPLDRVTLEGFKRCQVAAIFEAKFKKLKARSYTVEEMVDELCPRDTSAHTMAVSQLSRKRKLAAASLTARADELQAPETTSHQVYDIFHDYYSCIDQMDKVFYAHGRLRYIHHPNVYALHCAAFYVMSSCHAIYEEYQRENVDARSKSNNAQVAATQALSITDYLIKLTQEFKVKYKYT